MNFFKSFSRFIIFIIEGFSFGHILFICGGVRPIISVWGPATATAAAVATVTARRPMSSAAATIAITLMAMIASGIQVFICFANTQGELAKSVVGNVMEGL